MRSKMIFVLLICVLGLGAALTGCKDSGKKNNDALILLFQSSSSYFPEIPKGVAE